MLSQTQQETMAQERPRDKKEGTHIKTKEHKSFLLSDCMTDMEGKREMLEFH